MDICLYTTIAPRKHCNARATHKIVYCGITLYRCDAHAKLLDKRSLTSDELIQQTPEERATAPLEQPPGA